MSAQVNTIDAEDHIVVGDQAARCGVPCLCDEPSDLLVGGLVEVVVPGSDRVERRRLFEYVGLLAQLLDRVGSGHRCGQDDVRGTLRPDDLQRGARRGTRGHPIADTITVRPASGCIGRCWR